MKIEFIGRFRWRPTGRVSITYEPGMRANVTRACATAALAAGAARKIEVTDGKAVGTRKPAAQAGADASDCEG